MKVGNQLIIHIGCHKTGTTFLQHCVFSHMKDLTYLYKERDFDKVDSFVEHCHKVLLSDEEISASIPHRESVHESLMRLKKRFPDAKIIVGVRDFNKWFKSCYAQYIKAGGTMTFDRYCDKYSLQSWSTEKIANYCNVLWKDVLVYNQADLLKDSNTVIGEICEFIDCDMPEWTDERVNTSLKNLKLWRIINIITLAPILRKYVESPYWIITAIPRRIKKCT